MTITYEQARADHEYLWGIGEAYDMTGGYVDSDDLAKLLRKPSKTTARECYCRQIDYWFDVGPDSWKTNRKIPWDDRRSWSLPSATVTHLNSEETQQRLEAMPEHFFMKWKFPMQEKKELFKVAVRDQAGAIIETENPTPFYTGAHMSAKDYDADYPLKQAYVQRSLDEGQTWADYDADEFINGAPAWVHHLKIWQTANGA